MTDDGEEQVPEISAADEQALTDLFASLVAEAPASEVSPPEIIKLARIEQRHELDARIKRFKVLRNVLVAAAFAALVVLIVPHLGSGSSSTAASASSSSSSAADAPAGAATSPPVRSGVPAAGSAAGGRVGVPTYGAAVSEMSAAASAGSSASSAAASAAMASGPASAGAANSSAASSAALPVPAATGLSRDAVTDTSEASSSSSGAPTSGSAAASGSPGANASSNGCPPLSGRALAAFRSVFPAGYFGSAGRVDHESCTLAESRLPTAQGHVAVTVTVRRAAVGACRSCVAAPGQTGVYLGDVSGNGSLVNAPVFVYADGYEVAVQARRTGTNPVSPTLDQLVAGARAVIKTLG